MSPNNALESHQKILCCIPMTFHGAAGFCVCENILIMHMNIGCICATVCNGVEGFFVLFLCVEIYIWHSGPKTKRLNLKN